MDFSHKLPYYYKLTIESIGYIGYSFKNIDFINLLQSMLSNFHLNFKNEHQHHALFLQINDLLEDNSCFIKQFYRMRKLFIDSLGFVLEFIDLLS
jgi:hypothetical protein